MKFWDVIKDISEDIFIFRAIFFKDLYTLVMKRRVKEAYIKNIINFLFINIS